MAVFPLGAFPIALLVSFAAMPLVVRLAWATGYLDHPEARKLHTSATALLGGAGVFAVALAVWGAAMAVMPHTPSDWEAYYLLFGAGIALGLGLWDDRFGMSPQIKMLGQAAAATMIIAGGAVPELGLPAGVEGILALVALVALMNAVNFLDNMNGMVGGLAAIALLGFAWTSFERGRTASRRPSWRWRGPAWGSCRTTSRGRGCSWATREACSWVIVSALRPCWR